MSGLNTTYPIKAGSVRGALHGAADTDWHTLTSADFKDSVSGSACASSLRFATISLINTSTSNGARRTTSTVVDPRLPLNGHSPRRTTPVAVPVFWSHCEEEMERQTGPAPPQSP